MPCRRHARDNGRQRLPHDEEEERSVKASRQDRGEERCRRERRALLRRELRDVLVTIRRLEGELRRLEHHEATLRPSALSHEGHLGGSR